MHTQGPLRVLALGAHPDDWEIGCGGSMLRYAAEGNDMFLYVATKGERGGDPATRQREAERSGDMIGAKDIFWGGFIDCEIPNGLPLIQNIEKTIKLVNPHVVFVHSPHDTHQDHRALAIGAQSAARRVPNLLFYESPTTQHFSPSVFVNIESTITRKMDLLEAHFSQVARTNIEGLPITDIAKGSAIRRGIEIYKKYAEAFMPNRMFLL